MSNSISISVIILTQTIVSLSILPNLDEGFEHALVTSVPKSPVATCDHLPPGNEWQLTMNLILAVGMIIMILVSILTAYMEAMLYLKSQNSTASHSTNTSGSGSQSNHHNGKDYRRNNNHCSNQLAETCNKDRSSGSGNGANVISPSISSQQQQSASSSANGSSSDAPYNVHINGKSGQSNAGSAPLNKNQTGYSGGKLNSGTQKRRKNSSTVNASNEKVPSNSNNMNSNKSLIGSAASDKKSSSPYTPIFQNLTNVIASPPPPLPTFDNEFDSLEFKKFRGKRSAKKSNSLNGSIASNDDIANPNSLTNSQAHNPSSNQTMATSSQTGRAGRLNSKSNGFGRSGTSSSSCEHESDLQGSPNQGNPKANSYICKRDLMKNMSNSNSISDEESDPSNNKLYTGIIADRIKQSDDQPTVMPIQPPSNLSSTPSSTPSSSLSSSSKSSSKSSSSASSLKSTSASSSTSSSPPLPTTSSYGEYSLLGPGASFELPCLRVRSAQI